VSSFGRAQVEEVQQSCNLSSSMAGQLSSSCVLVNSEAYTPTDELFTIKKKKEDYKNGTAFLNIMFAVKETNGVNKLLPRLDLGFRRTWS
jgi:hypothetical protein